MELGLTKSRNCISTHRSFDRSLLASASRCFSLLLPLLLFLVWPVVQVANETTGSVPSKKQSALEYFDLAVQMRTSLESKPKRLRSATEYLKVINKFRSVYYTYPASSKADDALMAVAELFQSMANDLKDSKYFYQAIKSYDFLEDQYPNSPYCADAMFTSAEIQLNDLDDRKSAEDIFKEFLKLYPHSNKARNARARLDDLREQSRQAKRQAPKSSASLPKSSSENPVSGGERKLQPSGVGPTRSGQPTQHPLHPSGGGESFSSVVVPPGGMSGSPAEKEAGFPVSVGKKDGGKIVTETLTNPETNLAGSAKGPSAALPKNQEKPVRIRNIRYWEQEQFTRFVIDTDGEAQTVDGTLDHPARIFLDIQNAQLSTDLMGKTLPLDSGPLRQLRCGQSKENVARIVLDLADFRKYHLSKLKDPHRIVLDVESPASARQQAGAKPSVESKRVKRGDPLSDEVAMASGFEVASVLGSRRASSVESPVVAKKEDSKVHSAGGEEKPEVMRKQPSASSEKEAQAKSSKREVEATNAAAVLSSREARPKSDGTLSLIRTLGLKIGRIVIDPGHGGHDTGTVGPSGLEEKELVLDVAFRLKKLVEEKLNGEVILTRTDDTFVPLEERTSLANESQADLFISIHANSSENRRVSGVETFFLNFASSADVEEIAARENSSSQKTIFELQDLVQKIALKEKVDESKEFAQTVQKSMATQMQKTRASAKDRGVKQAPFIVLIGASMPSILSEISFVSNPSDEKLLKSPNYRQKIAEALCRGIEEYSRNLSGVKTAKNIGP